ncbi:MAG: HAD family hydrolase [Candidatus Diapherotrites archaeon]|nr:HAD family hydrolase [Candidatus Diapherotrites archaeon]
MNIKAVLLDLDGTLIDSIPLIMASDAAAIKYAGYKVTKQKLRELSQFHSRDIAYYLMDSKKTSFDLFSFVEYRRKSFVKLLRKHKARKLWFKDSKSFLEEMSNRFFLAVITGSRHMFVNEVFDKKTRNYLKFILTSDDVEHKKPDIEPLLKAINKLRLKKEEVVFIGDSIQDGLMCQRLGVKFIAKLGGISTENQLRKYNPVFIAKDFCEIKRFVELLEDI